MNVWLAELAVYALGFAGIFSIGLIPVRFWQVMKIMARNISERKKFSLPELMLALFASAALLINASIIARIFRCLTSTYCGPGVSSGWIYLAILGAVYVAFELAIFMIGRRR
jgi:hypothetical protein